MFRRVTVLDSLRCGKISPDSNDILYKYQKGFMRSMQTQTTGLHNLILDKYLAMPLYLPPYSEQQRIIKRIEVIFNTLDTIKESL